MRRVCPELLTDETNVLDPELLDNLELGTLQRTKRPSDQVASTINKKVKPLEDNFDMLLEKLDPFSFFITADPSLFDTQYCALRIWLEDAINKTIDIESSPFCLKVEKLRSPLFGVDKDYWDRIVEAVNDKKLLEENWRKFSIVNKAITLCDEDEWSDESYAPLRKCIWWVKTSNDSIFRGGGSANYLIIGSFALILELWHRFVWARHTKDVYESRITTGTNEELDSYQKYDQDEVIDINDLGTETDMEEDEESSDTNEDTASNTFDAQDKNSEEDIVLDTNESKPSSVPTVVSLFFNQVEIKLEIDRIESYWFDSQEWNIKKVIELFGRLCHEKQSQTSKKSLEMVLDQIWHYYSSYLSIFLKSLGIELSGEHNEIWNFNESPEFSEFLNAIITTSFNNLNNSGQSPSRVFLTLFQEISVNSDSRSLTRIREVYHDVYSKLVEDNKITPQMEYLISLIEKLEEEKRHVEEVLTKEASDENNEYLTDNLRKNMVVRREMTLNQINEDIEAIRSQLHELTGDIDRQKPTKSSHKKSIPMSDLITSLNINISSEETNRLDASDRQKKTSISIMNLIE